MDAKGSDNAMTNSHASPTLQRQQQQLNRRQQLQQMHQQQLQLEYQQYKQYQKMQQQQYHQLLGQRPSQIIYAPSSSSSNHYGGSLSPRVSYVFAAPQGRLSPRPSYVGTSPRTNANPAAATTTTTVPMPTITASKSYVSRQPLFYQPPLQQEPPPPTSQQQPLPSISQPHPQAQQIVRYIYMGPTATATAAVAATSLSSPTTPEKTSTPPEVTAATDNNNNNNNNATTTITNNTPPPPSPPPPHPASSSDDSGGESRGASGIKSADGAGAPDPLRRQISTVSTMALSLEKLQVIVDSYKAEISEKEKTIADLQEQVRKITAENEALKAQQQQ